MNTVVLVPDFCGSYALFSNSLHGGILTMQKATDMMIANMTLYKSQLYYV